MIGMESVNATLAMIPQYTGLSVGTFFTIVALVLGIYYLLSGLLAPAPIVYVKPEPLPPPEQLGEITGQKLQGYNGSDLSKPLLMAIKGQIYDVSQSRAFYGPGGPYALFAGKDASRALAKMSFEEKDLTGNIEGLSAYEIEALTDWEYKFKSKYVQVGTVKPTPPESDEVATESSENAPPADE